MHLTYDGATHAVNTVVYAMPLSVCLSVCHSQACIMSKQLATEAVIKLSLLERST